MKPGFSPTPLSPGLLVLHGNRLEQLLEVLADWLRQHPLAPLEAETWLVQSNGMAEWLKGRLAQAHGVCAATRVELPSRFVWRSYRSLLGPGAVPSASPLDKQPLAWRLMRLLPALVAQPVFAPVAGFLGADDDALRRWQLAQRLADLFDQYQVHRADWLQDWAAGHDRLRDAQGRAATLPPASAWQPALWRALLAELSPAQRDTVRPALQRRFEQALQRLPGAGAALAESRVPGLPRRLLLFGSTHVPQQLLHTLAALAAHVQVLVAVPNPSRYHWADLVAGRELLQAARRRQPLRAGVDLAALPPAQLHAFGHPLLAAWGRQARDFVRQLDVLDEGEQARERLAWPRVDLFDDGPGTTLLAQVQAAVRDLVPVAEQQAAAQGPSPDDCSIVFHIAHGPQREVEILHDQLLHLFAHPPGGAPLAPREVVVMVPDIAGFAPAIRAVFGAFPRGHARHVPWAITDLGLRDRHPLVLALEWLLRLPQQRVTYGELAGLLQLSAVQRRFGIAPEDLPGLLAWVQQAGVRWGLSAEHRQGLGLDGCGDVNSWAFGLARLLMGYAAGELPAEAPLPAIEPQSEVGGLAAAQVGALAELLQVLQRWLRDALQPRAPAAWAERLRALLADCLAAGDDGERALLVALDEALAQWLQACEDAGLEEALDLAVVREAWMSTVDDPASGAASQRFGGGGVTFCTLLPLRAVPFEVVCLLGMNDGDYPRRSRRSDFDLMALAGQARPGDRSRRDDDRQLMLDALLSARRVLYVSWAGRSARDNQAQPPSVLVGQLRDHLQAVWGEAVLRQRTTEHPLQPFSRRYFEPGSPVFTYAAEWRAAHETSDTPAAPAPVLAPPAAHPPRPLSLSRLGAFLRQPVRDFFRQRLQVAFDELPAPMPDDEAFALDGLQRWQLQDEILRAARRTPALAAGPDHIAPWLARAVQRLHRAGRLPLGAPGRAAGQALAATLQPMLQQWQALLAQHPQALDKRAVWLADPQVPGLVLDDWLLGLRRGGGGDGDGEGEGEGSLVTRLELVAGRLAAQGLRPQADKFIQPWLQLLAAAATGEPVAGVVVGADAVAYLAPPPLATARESLLRLMQACRASDTGDAPWPTAARTALAWLAHPDDPGKARAAFEGSAFGGPSGEGQDEALAKLFPDFASLASTPGFEEATRRLYGELHDWVQASVRLQALPDAAPLDDDTGDDDGSAAVSGGGA